MPVKKLQSFNHTVFFCTFTCYKWYHLFEITKFYDGIYNWFNILIKSNNQILGYVVMPNHVHVLINYLNPAITLNRAVGTGKRFMAYEIIERLKNRGEAKILTELSDAVTAYDRKNGKLHEVFKPSFDHKPCETYQFIEQKLEYIHHNPTAKHWQLTDDWKLYLHSSASFYETGQRKNVIVTHYRNVEL